MLDKAKGSKLIAWVLVLSILLPLLNTSPATALGSEAGSELSGVSYNTAPLGLGLGNEHIIVNSLIPHRQEVAAGSRAIVVDLIVSLADVSDGVQPLRYEILHNGLPAGGGCFPATPTDMASATDSTGLLNQECTYDSTSNITHTIEYALFEDAGQYSVVIYYIADDTEEMLYIGPFTLTVVCGLGITGMAASETRRAIYVLPGYLGSQLFVGTGSGLMSNDTRVFGRGTFEEIFVPWVNTLTQNEFSGGTAAGYSHYRDPYGTWYGGWMYEALVQRLRREFVAAYGGNGEFDAVIFFPYNWLGDLNDSARLLETHIDGRHSANNTRYDRVVLVAHSTGGLLAASYIARGNNRLRVDGVFMVGAPLFGTFASLEPIEFGITRNIQSYFDILLTVLDAARVIAPIFGIPAYWFAVIANTALKTTVRAMSINSPTTYQLLPSTEHLKRSGHNLTRVTREWRWGRETRTLIDTASGMHSVMNNRDHSSRINPRLTSGGIHSHRHFRDVTLGGSIESLLRQVPNVHLIGNFSDRNIETPTRAEYSNWGIIGSRASVIHLKGTGDGTVTGHSATMGFSRHFPRHDFPGVSHTGLVSNENVLRLIVSQIRNISAVSGTGLNAAPAGMFHHPTGISMSDGTMEDLLRINIAADAPVNIEVLDALGTVVASMTESDVFGFNAPGFLFRSLAEDSSTSIGNIMMPSNGHLIRFTSIHPYQEVNLDVIISPLDRDGNRIGVGGYTVTHADGDNMILTLNMVYGVTMDNADDLAVANGTLLETFDAAFNVNWSLDTGAITLSSLGESAPVAVTGAAAQELVWKSTDETVVTVVDGVITAAGFGSAIVYAQGDDHGDKIEQVDVTVTLHAASVSFDNLTLVLGERRLVQPLFNDLRVTETEIDLDFDPAYAGIIAIDDGVIIGLSPGIVQVTGTAESGVSSAFIVEVGEGLVTPVLGVSVKPPEDTVPVGYEITFIAALNPSNATIQDVIWHVDNESIASIVSVDGDALVVRGVRTGSTAITAVTIDGGFTDTAIINVTGALQGFHHPTMLLPPRNLSISGTVLNWSSMPGATGYQVYVGGQLRSGLITSTSYDLAALNLGAGTHAVQVRAVGDGYDRTSSALSPAVDFIVQGEPAAPSEPPGQPEPTPEPAVTADLDLAGGALNGTVPAVLTFSDVSPADWFYDVIKFAAENGLFHGTGHGRFEPDVTMSRAMFAQVLANMAGLDTSADDMTWRESSFTDVTPGEWHNGAVNWVAAMGICPGTGGGLFAPDEPITREDMAGMLLNFAQVMNIALPRGETEPFADQEQVSWWAYNAVRAMQAAGIIQGRGNGYFWPRATATRAEVAAIFAMFLQVAR